MHGKESDDFWPRAEENLLKAFVFYLMENKVEKNTLADIYSKIAREDIAEIDTIFKKLPQDSPATIKSSVLTGLGTRLQAFQNKYVQRLTECSDIDLSLPGKQACAYYCITSDMNSDMDFLVSLNK